MNEPIPVTIQNWIDDYIDGCLDADGMQQLEAALQADASLRAHFVRYLHLNSELHQEARSQQIGTRILAQLETESTPPRSRRRWVLAASLLLLVGLSGWWWWGGSTNERAEIAWLINAQNVRWAEGYAPNGPIRAGSTLHLETGLAELRFASGAIVLIEGPARLELRDGKLAQLQRGKLSARVPEEARGFTVLSPTGKVIDLGTEFGMVVGEDGETIVEVFRGIVDAESGGQAQRLTDQQAVKLADGQIAAQAAAPEQFTRAIVPPPVPRTHTWKFATARDGTLLDRTGRGTGLTHRLPGTGAKLGERDPNLHLNTDAGVLELKTTNSDINTQFRLATGEYLGWRLSDYGFTGKEDFIVSAVFPNFPPLEAVNQFGLYAGSRSDRNIRGGIFSPRPNEYTQNLVNNEDGIDRDAHFVGLLSPGDSVRISLRRQNGRYSMTVENLTTNATTTLTIRHPAFLDAEADLYVGLFGANTRSKESKTLSVSELSLTVWTVVTPR